MKNLSAILLCFIITLHTGATDLRGRIMHSVSGVNQPMGNARVDLIILNGTQWVDVAFAITDNDGYYYFLNYDVNKQFFISFSGKYYPTQPLIIQDIHPPLYQDISTIIN